jgi:superfamily I DNA/RNA helicase
MPTPIQTAAAEAPGPVVVLEYETGSGKTEAALLRFARLFTQGRVDARSISHCRRGLPRANCTNGFTKP